jgi:membrane protease YdiL (CAAX protease family)
MSSNKRLWIFVALTCLISWVVAGAMHFAGIKVGSIQYTVAGALYMLVPAAVAVLLQKYTFKEAVKTPFQISFKLNRWFAVALFTPVLITFLSLGIGLLLPGIEFSRTGEGIIERYSASMTAEQLDLMREQITAISPAVMVLITLGQGILAACTINALFAFGEELGWRGYMQHYLKGKSLIKASLIIGTVWGVWHFPLILMGHNYPTHPATGVFMMIAFCILLTPAMMYIVLKSKSVISAAIFQGSVNAFAGFPLIYLTGGNDLSDRMMVYAGFIAIILATAGFYLYDKYLAKENLFEKKLEADKQL